MSTRDYTTEIYALQNARIDMQAVKAKNRAEIAARYKAKIAEDTKQADAAAEYHFATLLKAAVEAGVPQSLIRSEVLRTNVWSRWTYWRDMAEIKPERIAITDAKEAARLDAMLWREYKPEERKVMWVKDFNGKPLPYEFEVTLLDADGWVDYDYDIPIRDWFGAEGAFNRKAHEMLKKEFGVSHD